MAIRQRMSWNLPEARVRRIQGALWVVIVLLALAIDARTFRQQFDDTVNLVTFTPHEAADYRAHLQSFGISNYSLTVANFIGYGVQWALSIVFSAILLLRRKGTDWFAFYIALTFVAGIGAIFPPSLPDLVDRQPVWMAIGMGLTALSITSLFLLPMLFPTGHFVPRWMAIVAALFLLSLLQFIVYPAGDPTRGMGRGFEIGSDLLLLGLIIGSLIYRYRWKSNTIQRQQMKWGGAGLVVAMLTFLAGDAMMRNISGSLTGVLSALGFIIAVPIFSLVFPFCLTIAILKYRLFDIDLIISRTLIWLFMTALVIAAYAGIVFGIGSRLQGDQNTLLSLIAIGLTAALFQPVRLRVQQAVNRLLFGNRDEPYQVVRKLAGDLSETVQPIEALRATVRTLTDTLRLPYAAIAFEPGAPPVAVAGHAGPTEISFPLVYQSQPAGELIVSPRSGSREFDAADRKLLTDLAQQIGVVAHNVRLTNDLQASRERIVTAREEERRRLRRDLHDGLGAQLAALTLQTGALKRTIHTDPDTAIAQATELQVELQQAINDIRRLVQGLRPTALDDLGLVGALRARIATIDLQESTEFGEPSLRVTLDAPAELGPLPAAVEVAIYRIVDEALTNVVHHANAARCQITITREAGGILFTIEDDGAGIPADRVSGVGMQSMRERALELGGTLVVRPGMPTGTRIEAHLPIAEPEK